MKRFMKTSFRGYCLIVTILPKLQTAVLCTTFPKHKLDDAEWSVLSLGLNYNLAPQPDVKKVVCAVESAVMCVDPSRRDEARTRVVGVLSKLRRNQEFDPLSPEERKALKRLRDNKDIVILPADKGNATVVLDTQDYENKMRLMLEDDRTYVPLNRDPTAKVQRDLQKLLADGFRFVPPQQKSLYFSLLCNNGSAPALYGLPKIHKEGVPMRPIVDFTRSPLHKLSNYLHRIISPLVGKTETHVRNSYDFIEKVRNTVLHDDEIMVSFDVKSLYTSVPIDFAVKVCTDALESDPSLPERTPLEAPDLSRLLEFCLSNTYLTFQKKFFKQVHGTAMGASISVTAANLAMESLESRALSSFNPRPRVFLRYVDDCFSVVKKSALSAFLLHLNSMDPAIQFTTEEEVNGRLPFLDVLVKRDGSSLSFSVFRKETHTGKYLSFSSVHPMCQKKSVVASLVRRAEKLSSTPENQAAELATIRRDLSSSGYPSSFIQAVKKSLAHPTPNDSQQYNDKGKRKRIPVPYVPGISESLSRILRGYEVDVASRAYAQAQTSCGDGERQTR
ncbi:uncharacterized protein LOC119382905 [Rhipicephalus sanguineus]|uniref:uncharacterized protein LOC119382905 n=1 Tax=Rhipicephalus sanguineus TaxID=34632 RepID=UPI0020C33C11|nr:uncharacterized protein LOC119382905 [Rhipicephalus sanguineus]